MPSKQDQMRALRIEARALFERAAVADPSLKALVRALIAEPGHLRYDEKMGMERAKAFANIRKVQAAILRALGDEPISMYLEAILFDEIGQTLYPLIPERRTDGE